MPPYSMAIEQTKQIIHRRTKNFRDLIVAVTCVVLSFILFAGTNWSWVPLTGLFLLFPICGVYLFIDGILLNRWRNDLFGQWTQREIDFRALQAAIAPIPTLPRETIEKMLESLPLAEDLVSEQAISSSTRKEIAAVVTKIHTIGTHKTAFRTAEYTLIGGAIIFSLIFWMWEPLLVLLAVFLIILISQFEKTQRLKGIKERISAVQQTPDFNSEIFLDIIHNMDWTPVSTSERKIKRLLATLSNQLHPTLKAESQTNC